MVARQFKCRAVIVTSIIGLFFSSASAIAGADSEEGYVVWRKVPSSAALVLESMDDSQGISGDNRFFSSSFSNRPGQNNYKDLGRGFALVNPPRQKAAATLEGAVGSGAEVSNLPQDFCTNFVAENPDFGCEPNFTYKTSVTPNDPKYSEMWGLNGTYGIDAANAWDLTTGSDSIVVAVIDTGIDYTHPDLAQNIWVNTLEIPGNGIDDDDNGYVDDIHGVNTLSNSGDPMDDNGHGTHVSGTIAGVSNNALGVSGIAWNTKIMGLKFLASSGSGNLSDAIAAINYMIAMKERGVNIRVSNNSWGGSDYSASLEAAIREATEAGILFSVAAGNESNDNDASPSYPASYTFNELLSVAAIDVDGQLASFSNYGFTSVHIAAPGVDILSTTPGEGYLAYSGTSMAAPHVSGIAALLAASEPNLSARELAIRIMEAGIANTELEGKVFSGRFVSANRAVRALVSPLPSYASGEPCSYAFAPNSGSPEVQPGRFFHPDSRPIIVDDELSYRRVRLDFEFPFFGQGYSQLGVSPNGVIYFGRTPKDMDFINKVHAPEKSIAVLHSDLFFPEDDMGVFVERSEDRVLIMWYGRHYYNPKSGWLKAWAILNESGVVETHYRFSDSITEEIVMENATVGTRKVMPSSATTYSYNSSKIVSNTTLDATNACLVIAPLIYQFDLEGLQNRKASAKVATLGQQVTLNINTNRPGIVPVFFSFGDSNRCSSKIKLNIDESLSGRLVGRLPSQKVFPSGVGKLVSQARGTSRSLNLLQLDRRGKSRQVRDRRAKLRPAVLNSTCSRLISSFKVK